MTSSEEVDLAIGVFDGVHRGHQYLLERMVEDSTQNGRTALCLTFDPHPEVVLYPERAARALCSLGERLARLRELGIARVDLLPFTLDVARQSAQEFVAWLHSEYGLHALWAGSDFALGRDRMGTVDVLREIGKSLGFVVRAVEPLHEDNRPISSTWIRELLADGDVRRAAALLGRPYVLEGPVVEGARRGRELGFPTANLVPEVDRALPADGVYAVGIDLDSRSLRGVANLGSRPTFDEGQRLLETHVLDFDEDLYGAEVRISFLERLRGVQRFGSVVELRRQIERDVEMARSLFERERAELSTG